MIRVVLQGSAQAMAGTGRSCGRTAPFLEWVGVCTDRAQKRSCQTLLKAKRSQRAGTPLYEVT